MRRWFNGEIALGFATGVVLCLFVASVLSYQASIDLFHYVVWSMDHHEGFFVSLFTLALSIATLALWWSTRKLWLGGEKQINILRQMANTNYGDTCFITLLSTRENVRLICASP